MESLLHYRFAKFYNRWQMEYFKTENFRRTNKLYNIIWAFIFKDTERGIAKDGRPWSELYSPYDAGID